MSPSADTRLEVSRVIRAARAKVFEAWIRPEMMKKWFCPQELVVDSAKSDARVGGKYRIAMKDVDRNKIFTVFGIYKEITPNQKLVFTWEWEEPNQTESLVTVTFRDRDGGTEVAVLHERYVDMEGEGGHREGWMSALENLGKKMAHAAKETGDREIVISRTFDAPRERVWKAWTDPEQVVKWWGPRTFTIPVCKMDFRVGGRVFSCMRSDQGPEIWQKGIYCTGVYKEIVPMEKIVCTDCFADEHGNVVPASYYGMEGDFSLEMLVTVTFEVYQGNKTKITLRHSGLPAGEHLEGVDQGWNESFDKLAERLCE